MSVKEANLKINIQDGMTGNIVRVVDYEDYYYDNDLSINVTCGEYYLFKAIRDLLNDKKDVFIKLGYNS